MMKRFLALMLVFCMAFMAPGQAYAAVESKEESTASAGPTLEELKAEIAAFEEKYQDDNGNMKAIFHKVLKEDFLTMAEGELDTAFEKIEARFEEMIKEKAEDIVVPENEGKEEQGAEEAGSPEEATESMLENLKTQLILINATFSTKFVKSLYQLVVDLSGKEIDKYADAMLNSTPYDFMELMKRSYEGKGNTESAAKIGEILETLENKYDKDVMAYYKALTAPKDLPEGESGPGTEPAAPNGEENTGDQNASNQFKVIQEEIAAAFARIDAKLQDSEAAASEKYGITAEQAEVIYELLNKASRLVNAQMADIFAEIQEEMHNHDMEHVAAVDATTTSEGNIEYYYCKICDKYFSDADGKNEIEKDSITIPKLEKSAQTMTVKAAAKTVKVKKLKKKAITVAPLTVAKAQGTVTYKVAGGTAKGKKALKLNTKTGKVRVKKGTGKGTYKIKVTVTAAGNDQYKEGSKSAQVVIKVK